MKKVLLSLAALTAISAAATPAAADHDRRNSPARQINVREAQIDRQIDRAAARGQITRYEAYALNQELRRIEALERHYRRGGLTRWEVRDLKARLNHVRERLQHARRDDHRRYGYGSGLSFSLGLGQRW